MVSTLVCDTIVHRNQKAYTLKTNCCIKKSGYLKVTAVTYIVQV